MRRSDDLRNDTLSADMKINHTVPWREKEDADGVLSRKIILPSCHNDYPEMKEGDYFDIEASAALNMASNEPFSFRAASVFSATAR